MPEENSSVSPSDRHTERTVKYSNAARFAKVQAAKRDRARRLEHLPSELFAEPAWDILLELYAFKLVAREVAQSELVARINVPPSTSIRWLKMLEAEGLVTRKTGDGRPDVALTLTRMGIHALDTYFDSASETPQATGVEPTFGTKLKLVTRD